MRENAFPWEHHDVMIKAFAKHSPMNVELFRCTCAEPGAYFTKDGDLLSIIEQGWVPFAWRDDDSPKRDDAKFPPMWTDYLTENTGG